MNLLDFKKVRCRTPGCGFVADLLPDGSVVSDVMDPPEQRVPLHENEDGTFECLPCGAPIALLAVQEKWVELCQRALVRSQTRRQE